MPPLSRGDRSNKSDQASLGKPIPTGDARRNCPESNIERPLGWSVTASRIADWTSRLLVSFLIVAAALVFTSQILRWWRVPETPPVTAVTSPNNEGWTAVEWVDADWTTTLYTASGPEEEVTNDLARRMLQAAQRAAIPPDPPNEKELSVLRRLTERQPFLKGEQGSAVYRLNQSLPIWLGTRSAVKNAPAEPGQPEDLDSTGSGNDAGSANTKAARIVAWGFIVPMDGDLWRIALAVSGSNPSGRRTTADIPLPVGAEPGFTIRFGDGTMLRAFRGNHVNRSAWMAHFDHWLDRHGWSADARWQIRNNEAVRRYRRSQSGDHDSSDYLLVTLREDGDAARGFVMQESSPPSVFGSDGGGSESEPP